MPVASAHCAAVVYLHLPSNKLYFSNPKRAKLLPPSSAFSSLSLFFLLVFDKNSVNVELNVESDFIQLTFSSILAKYSNANASSPYLFSQFRIPLETKVLIAKCFCS